MSRRVYELCYRHLIVFYVIRERNVAFLKEQTVPKCKKSPGWQSYRAEREKGMGKRKNKADALNEEEEKLWDTGVLGGKNPKSLKYTVLYVLSQQYGTGGCQEHHQLRIEHLKLVRDPTTGKTVSKKWVEGPTKTRLGGLNKKDDRRLPQKLLCTRWDSMSSGITGVSHIETTDHSTLLRATLFASSRNTPRRYIVFYATCRGEEDQYMHERDRKTSWPTCILPTTKIINHSIRKTTVLKKLKKAGVSNDRIADITMSRI